MGFSLGGNLVAKLAGELGGDAPPLLAGVVAASAAIDLFANGIAALVEPAGPASV